MNTDASNTENPQSLDLDRLLKLRLVVARYGEMDVARWWNTKGMLGRYGKTVLSRGFPRTHYFAQARVVFAVAKSRCQEVFDPPGSMTLWSLPAEIEDHFEDRWHQWLDQRDQWEPLFESLQAINDRDLLNLLLDLKLVTTVQAENARTLGLSAEGRAAQIPGIHVPDNATVALLAAGFSRGSPGHLAVPYARLGATDS
jgi:hypothetical protein